MNLFIMFSNEEQLRRNQHTSLSDSRTSCQVFSAFHDIYSSVVGT